MATHITYAWLLLLPLASILLYLLTRKRKEGKKARHMLPPGPKKLPIIGNLHQIGTLSHRSLWLLSQKHGPVMHLQLGRIPTLVVSSAAMAREVLKTHDLDFCSRPQLLAPSKLFYHGLDVAFAPYGEYWREMRKICILELFSVKRVQSFHPIREEEISRVIKSISSSSSTPINLSKMMYSLTNRIICTVALGKKYEEGEYEKSRFHGVLEEVQTNLASFCIADFFPSLGWIDKLNGLEDRLEKNASEIDAFFEEVIEEHLDPKRLRPKNEDIVDVLLRLQKETSHLTKDHIKGVLMDIFIGGTDTGSATLVWAMTELIRNPRVMKKAQEEVRRSIGTKGKAEESDLHQLQYLKSVVKEIMRLHSPVPLLVQRETIRHCKINGYDIFPKTRVFVNAWAIGRDPESWNDPEEFLPERFMGSSIDFKGHDFELIPFGSGRRTCPALYFGTLTIELALANLLYYFEWHLPDGKMKDDIDMIEAPGLTVHKESALNLVATKYDMKKIEDFRVCNF